MLPPDAALQPRAILQREFERRCKANPRYSLRAFAHAMRMSPAGLSYALTGKRPVSKGQVKRMLALLPLSPEDCESLTRYLKALTDGRRHASLNGDEGEGSKAFLLGLDSFSFISDWYHYGILSLLEIPGARSDARWVARQLGISEIEAKNAFERLQRLGVIEESEGRWKQSVGPIRIGSDVPTAATKKFQRQVLLKAIDAIENESDECKDASSMTFAMDPSLIPHAKERIRQFRRQLTAELEAMGSPKRVYKLSVQIFPVSLPVGASLPSQES